MTAVSFTSLTPVFTVDDVAAALDHYTRVLGFTVAWTWGEPAERAAVRRDGVEIMLSRRGTADDHGPSRAYVQVRGIDALHATMAAAGAAIEVGLGDRGYGMRDFHIVDPGGNRISFGEATLRQA